MTVLDWRKLVERTGFLAVSTGLVLLGLIQGVQTYSLKLNFFFVFLEVLLIDAAVSSIFFTGFLLASFSVFFWRLGASRTDREPENEKSVCCIVPTYQDSEVLDNSIETLLESDYENFEIVIVCEEYDEKSIERAEQLSDNPEVNLLVNTGYPGSKAGAINFAVKETDSDLVAVFDADQRVKPDFLAKAVSLTDSNQVVQGRHLPRPDGLIESLAYYESLIFSYVVRQPLNILTDFRLIGSRATVIERSAFEKIGGYSDDTLTEDYDFAHECYRRNIETVELLNTPVPEESAHSLKDWWCQRKRWMTGYFQVFAKTFRRTPTEFNGRRSIISLLICGGSILGSILMLTLVSKFVILLVLGAESIYLVPLGSILAIALAGRLHDGRTCHIGKIGWSWILTPLIFPLFSLITVKAFFEFLLDGEKEWYRVDKD